MTRRAERRKYYYRPSADSVKPIFIWGAGIVYSVLMALLAFSINTVIHRIDVLEELGSPHLRERVSTVETKIGNIMSTLERQETILNNNRDKLDLILHNQQDMNQAMLNARKK